MQIFVRSRDRNISHKPTYRSKVTDIPIPDPGIISAKENTELGEALDNLNNDTLDEETGMSNIDLRARLHPLESSAVLALDGLVALSVLPKRCLAFSRQKKRLSVSDFGKGREEIVSITKGKREDDIQTGQNLFQRMNPFSGTGGK